MVNTNVSNVNDSKLPKNEDEPIIVIAGASLKKDKFELESMGSFKDNSVERSDIEIQTVGLEFTKSKPPGLNDFIANQAVVAPPSRVAKLPPIAQT